MVEGVQIREAQADDLPAVVQVIHAAFAEYKGVLVPPSSAHRESVETLTEKLKTSTALIAEKEDELFAVVFFANRGDHLYLDRLSVIPKWRKRGMGAFLIGEIERRTLEASLRETRLCVRLQLQENIQYYERMGYERLKEFCHESYAQPTFVMMRKALTPLPPQRPVV